MKKKAKDNNDHLKGMTESEINTIRTLASIAANTIIKMHTESQITEKKESKNHIKNHIDGY
ncbi:MAG: hypothetical protein K0S44_1889 [Bacteroidetes bacterium]|jgi:hypothetical protein|nr:hypothetical protein [Bacteroidota bacterium]